MTGAKNRLPRIAVILGIAAVGLVLAGYVLVKERFPVPFRDVYEVQARLKAADGVAPGVGQGVNVSGVKVGSITDATLDGDTAKLTLQIQREELPRVYANARVNLRPITPVKDMELDLEPGAPPARPLRDGEALPTAQSSTPVPLSDLLSTLDADTRAFLATMLSGAGVGTKGRAPDLRRALLALGPTTGQLRQMTTALAERRVQLARLVHNVSSVTTAAASNGRLADMVVAGNDTLRTISRQDAALKATLSRMPGALSTASDALRDLGALSDEIRPTMAALTPQVRRLPATLTTGVQPVAREIATTLKQRLRPFLREAQPFARKLAPVVTGTERLAPDLSRSLQVLKYAGNELGYNPPGAQEGNLYWTGWFVHNWLSTYSIGDAHGSIGRVNLFVNCRQITKLLNLGPLLDLALGNVQPCKE